MGRSLGVYLLVVSGELVVGFFVDFAFVEKRRGENYPLRHFGKFPIMLPIQFPYL